MNKKGKDDKYESMLRKLDLKLENKAPKSFLPDEDDDGFITVTKHESKGVSLSDLLSKLDNNPEAQNTSSLKAQVSELENKAVKIVFFMLSKSNYSEKLHL
jgi:hypothetical protein